MIGRIEPERLRPEQKAELIYAQARNELSDRLWRAALGNGGADSPQDGSPGESAATNLETLLALLTSDDQPALTAPPSPAAAAPAAARTLPAFLPAAPAPAETTPVAAGPAAGLGPNAQHRPNLEQAAQRTGIPTAALAAIVDAEAAKDRDGGWKLYSRNPRSSAAGLGQFLAGTWVAEAERPGTWLNGTARDRGWLTDSGRVAKDARSELLALRYDGAASIQATADYAKGNLDRLRKAGVEVGNSVESVAQTAYLGHHLGAGDAIKFLKGGIDDRRAAMLLRAQVGASSAHARLAAVGDASSAHRQWLMGFVERHIRPERFLA
jgi:hypothetical protein